MKTCQNCAAFSAMTKECRRHAPTAVPIQKPDGFASMGLYPATNADKWCLEHVSAEVTP